MRFVVSVIIRCGSIEDFPEKILAVPVAFFLILTIEGTRGTRALGSRYAAQESRAGNMI